MDEFTDEQENSAIFTPPIRTGKEICKYIAAWMLRDFGEVVDPDAIWNYSPTGELFMVYEYYATALCQTEKLDQHCDKELNLKFVPTGTPLGDGWRLLKYHRIGWGKTQ